MALNESFIPGATVVGLTFKNGVVLGAEKMVAYGRFVVSRSGKKVFPITDSVGAAFAGMMGDMQILVREISSYVKIRELEQKRKMAPNSIAKLMSVILFERRYVPFITQTILGGVNGKPSIYVLDPLGSVIPDDYACIGSGAEIAIGVVEAGYQSEMTEDQAKDLATKAIKSASQRDAASGKDVDLLIITRSGQKAESTSV